MRLGNVIENENLIRMAIDEFDCLWKMLSEDEQIVAQSIAFKKPDARVEIAAQHVVWIGLVVQDVSYAS